MEKLIGVNCTLNMIDAEKSDGSPTQKISAIMPKMPNAQNMIAVNNMDQIPAWIEKKRSQSVEATAAGLPAESEQSAPGNGAIEGEENLPF